MIGAWNRFKPKIFTVDISNANELYNISLCVTVDTSLFHDNSLPMLVNVVSPAGERRMFPCSILLRDKSGEWNGEWQNGLLVVDKCIRDSFSFNRDGEHSVSVGQGTHYYDIKGIRAIRLHIEETKIDYPE